MTASSIVFNISRLQQPRRCARFVPGLEELLGEPEDLRPETPLQISGVNRQGRDSTIQGLTQPPDPMAEVPEPAPATTVPGPGRQGNLSARPRLEGEKAQDVLQSQGIPVPQAHVPQLPGRCEEAPRRLSEDLGEDTLSALEGASGFF